jgi:hypothetical protein
MATKYVLGLVAGLALMAPAAMAGNYPSQSFDAQYDVTNAQGKTAMRMACDGKGHFLTQTEAAGQKYVTLVDYLKNTSTTLIPQGKMAMQSKLPANGGYIADDSSIKAAGGKLIGTKVVNGHPCHGYEYSKSGVKSQVWIGDDCHISVQSTTEGSGIKTVMNLKSVSGAPSADSFNIPAGYKMMNQ